MGRGIEPRNEEMVGANAVSSAEGSTSSAEWPGMGVPPGSEARAHLYWGRPGTWEALPSPPYEEGEDEETKFFRMDGRESEHLHSTREAGEPVPRDPVEGRRVSESGTTGGKGGWEL